MQFFKFQNVHLCCDTHALIMLRYSCLDYVAILMPWLCCDTHALIMLRYSCLDYVAILMPWLCCDTLALIMLLTNQGVSANLRHENEQDISDQCHRFHRRRQNSAENHRCRINRHRQWQFDSGSVDCRWTSMLDITAPRPYKLQLLLHSSL